MSSFVVRPSNLKSKNPTNVPPFTRKTRKYLRMLGVKWRGIGMRRWSKHEGPGNCRGPVVRWLRGRVKVQLIRLESAWCITWWSGFAVSDSPSRISCFTFGLRERHTLIPFPGLVLSDFLVLMALFDPRVLSPRPRCLHFHHGD